MSHDGARSTTGLARILARVDLLYLPP